ncbi:lamin tail domain-containing protein [Candidatus Saccharibacteria bacterium]|nr:lamin tail domain-containing protein [Candidatus Saccharibacteria bacterium]
MKKIILFCKIICLVWAVVGIDINMLVFADKNTDSSVVGDGEDVLPEIYIKAINPGYKDPETNKNNTGEMIEIARRDNSSEPTSLAGLSISYTDSSGTPKKIFGFPEYSWMAGESILLRLASSPESELANINYSKTLAMDKGPLTIERDGEILDSVCWTGKDDCQETFKSSNPTVLVRQLDGSFKQLLVDEYEVKYDEKNYYVEARDETGYGAVKSQCVGMKFSEILTYYTENKEEQFIELYNSGAEQILLDGCQIKYKNKNYNLKGIVKPEEYIVIFYKDLGFSLTKNPTNSNALELIDVDGAVIDTLVYPNGQRKGTSYAWIGYSENGDELWKVTYAPTPGSANNYQEYKTCEAGKVINEATGNCVKVTSVSQKVCGEGKYLNVLTGRCKKIEETTEKVCKEGYYLNPKTNRCNKIKENTGADYSINTEETYDEKSSFVALYAVIGVVVAGLLYIIYEFRREIGKVCRRVLEKLRRGIGRH